MYKLHIKVLALNIDFDGPSLNFLGSRKSVHEGIKLSAWSYKVLCPIFAIFDFCIPFGSARQVLSLHVFRMIDSSFYIPFLQSYKG